MIAIVAMARDEADIAQRWARWHWGQGVDAIYCLDNGSTDDTAAILDAEGVVVIPDPERAHYQAAKMNRLAACVAQTGVEWIVPTDLDEFWHGGLAQVLGSTDLDVVQADVFDHAPDGTRYASPQRFPIVAYRWHPDARLDEGNHAVAHPGRQGITSLVVEHYPYRSYEQWSRKVRQGREALELTDLPVTTGEHWRRLGALSDDELRAEWVRLGGT